VGLRDGLDARDKPFDSARDQTQVDHTAVLNQSTRIHDIGLFIT
jgi:hypothetical protein